MAGWPPCRGYSAPCRPPRPWGSGAASATSPAAHRARRAVAEENVAAAFPELDAGARRRIVVGGMYRHYGEELAQFARFPVLEPADIVRRMVVEGEHHLKEAVAAGRGGC